jgi:hypothetical protein
MRKGAKGNRARGVRVVDWRPWAIEFVPGVSWHEQIELLYRREHASRIWAVCYGVFCFAVHCEQLGAELGPAYLDQLKKLVREGDSNALAWLAVLNQARAASLCRSSASLGASAEVAQ